CFRSKVRILKTVSAKNVREIPKLSQRTESVLGVRQLLEQERPGVTPESISSSGRNTQRLGRLLGGETAEETQFDQLRRFRVGGGQAVWRLGDRHNVLIEPRDGEMSFVKRVPVAAGAPSEALFAPGGIYQDAAHGLGCGGEEVAATVPVLG